MILAAGLSPAHQQTLTFDSLQLGEVNRATKSVWCASGKVINVAMGAHTLGVATTLLTSVGGLSGEVIEQEIEDAGIKAAWVRTVEPMRVCTTLLTANGRATELVENTRDTSEQTIAEFVERTRTYANVADVVVLTGSLPGNAPPETFAKIVRNTPRRFILDFRGPALQFCLPLSPFLVKPNRAELESTIGQSLNSTDEILNAMRRLNDGGAAWVVVSDGERGLYVTSEDSAFRLVPSMVKTVNPIGCGDSLAAGIACELYKGKEVVEAVRFGMGAAANNAEQLLPARLNLERSQELADLVEVQEISLSDL
ncbi:1-phosphofructokinase family hexose kinase [Planctomicrobium sp. SH527]|uniref:1-phosphofructokinase family hexose kinase n=1 Tax=Planctomicrobium sp. SH527 TaxID=3448123 RepID=UPI003F5B2CB6